MTPRHLLPLVLLALATVAPVVAGSFPPQEKDAPHEAELGFLGFQPPEVGAIRVAEVLLHQDTTGGVIQQLLGIGGSRGGGFGLVWRDQRDGTLGIFCARIDADGILREPERPVTATQGTTRRFDPAVAIGPDGSGAVAWISRHTTGLRPWLRCFNAEGAWYGSDLVVPGGEGPSARAAATREAGAPGARSPVLLARRDGSRTLVWIEGARLRSADFDVAGSPLRAAVDLGPAGTDPEVGILAVEDSEGGLAALWNGKNGAWFTRRAPGSAKSGDIQLGEGLARGLVADPNGGFWIAQQRGESALLRRVNFDNKLSGAEVTRDLPGLVHLELAPSAGGLALLATRSASAAPAARGGKGGRNQIAGPSGATSGAAEPVPQRPTARGGAPRAEATASGSGPLRIELYLHDAEGVSTDAEPLVIASDAARAVADAHLASDGSRLLVAWTDARGGDADVWGRIVDPAQVGPARLGPEKRLNSDVASSDQINPDIDAAGDRGWTVWQDRRAGPGSVYARAFDGNGPSGDEILLPVQSGAAAADSGLGSEPVVAIRPDGSALFTWLRREENRMRVMGQVLGRDGTAQSGLIEIDAREPATTERAAIETLSGDRGWIVVWPAGNKLGIHARRIALDGTPAGPARRISDAGDDELRHVDVTMLDDGRLIAAWTSHAAGAGRDKGWTIRARFLDVDGIPKGSELGFEPSRRMEDHDPALAPANNGGFMMAWCSGLPSDPTHDINVRLFDGQGKPDGPNLTPCFLANEQDFPDITRLADGSFAVAWEDDVSYYDQTYVRRIAANGGSMGPWMRINQLDTLNVADRVTPRITAFGGGWAAVFADRKRSQGFDVRIKIVGAGFDPAAGG